jgi:hypothetical protein
VSIEDPSRRSSDGGDNGGGSQGNRWAGLAGSAPQLLASQGLESCLGPPQPYIPANVAQGSAWTNGEDRV